MRNESVYEFEHIDPALPFVPLAARRVLDVLGRKLSLHGWLSLSLENRRRMVAGGASDRVEAGLLRILDGAAPAPVRVPPQPEPDANHIPPELTSALGAARPLDDARWRKLHSLDRYVLAKCAAKREKLGLAYDELIGAPDDSAPPVPPASPSVPTLTHLTAAGAVWMVDVSGKSETPRRAVASACVHTTPAVLEAIALGTLAKGDVLAAARVAGILAAKRTPELVPLCHPVRTTYAAIDFEPDAQRGELKVRATIEAVDRTGVEMEAMVAVGVASLTVYDMIKSSDHWATIDAVRLDSKSGGNSGDIERPIERRGS